MSKSFGATVALDDVHLSAEGGKVFALLGPNGAGKTTLVRILTTLLRPDRATYRRRATDILGRFGLSDAADRMVRTYSGGMRRRLDIATALIASPPSTWPTT